ncbi:hypothetical protein Kfla_0030 [Kribbella flavida DSM 17836]|uniref:Uncharacterized protein n=1 Tax=Kribbella flavida (strain DSM 17836 / JCM 10339 / NBRC 14399) TaxID=479435 RepID=D2PQH3_KRIFD|nr:hypothetical protein [Kribbella flavida]ADB29160.1 hypothetical protein Kfla_0030 [Kribbella flavida DSM 17836]
MSPRAVDKRARPGNEGGPAATEPAADLAAVGTPENAGTALSAATDGPAGAADAEVT